MNRPNSPIDGAEQRDNIHRLIYQPGVRLVFGGADASPDKRWWLRIPGRWERLETSPIPFAIDDQGPVDGALFVSSKFSEASAPTVVATHALRGAKLLCCGLQGELPPIEEAVAETGAMPADVTAVSVTEAAERSPVEQVNYTKDTRAKLAGYLRTAAEATDWKPTAIDGKERAPTKTDRARLKRMAADIERDGTATIRGTRRPDVSRDLELPTPVPNGVLYHGPIGSKHAAPAVGPSYENQHVFAHDDTAPVPNNKVTNAYMLAALTGGPGFLERDGTPWAIITGRLICRTEQRRTGGYIRISPDLASGRDPAYDREARLAAAIAEVESYDTLTLDVMMALMAETAQARSPRESVAVTPRRIAEMKGLECHGQRGQNILREIALRVEQIQILEYTMRSIRYTAGKGKHRRYVKATRENDKLFFITKTSIEQGNLLADGPDHVDIVYSVRLGEWASIWFNRADPKGIVWRGTLAREVLQLSHRQDRAAQNIAKRIMAAYFIFPGAIIHVNRPIQKTNRDVLIEIGLAPPERDRDKKWPGRIRERVEEAILLLKDRGLISDAEWPNGYGPDDTDRSHGWAGRWLRARVVLTSTEVVSGGAAIDRGGPSRLGRPTRRDRSKAPAPADYMFDPNDVRRKCAEVYWSQKQLAGHLDIKASVLSGAMTGSRPASDVTLAKIRAFLETPNDEFM